MNDSVEHPAHYNFGQIEAREIIELAIADFHDPATVYHVASALKYLLRASRKNGADDIAKASKHIGWALDAARAHDKRRSVCRAYDPEPVAFRHGDIDAVCGSMGMILPNPGIRDAGEFTHPPNCVHESLESKERGHVDTVDSTHPMAAEALRTEDERPHGAPRRFSESAWAVVWPEVRAWPDSYVDSKPDAPQTEYQTLVGN